jgi:hypothetical protein
VAAGLSGEKTLTELSSEFGVYPTTIGIWKQEFIKRPPENQGAPVPGALETYSRGKQPGVVVGRCERLGLVVWRDRDLIAGSGSQVHGIG